jgi:hypothetical protein
VVDGCDGGRPRASAHGVHTFVALQRLSSYTLTVPELHTQQLLTLVNKALYHGGELPDVFSDYLTPNKSVHDHETRLQTDIHFYKANIAFDQRSVTYKGGFL